MSPVCAVYIESVPDSKQPGVIALKPELNAAAQIVQHVVHTAIIAKSRINGRARKARVRYRDRYR